LNAVAPKSSEVVIDSKELAIACAKACAEKKAENVAILDVSKSLAISEYFLVATGRNRRHLKSLSDAVREVVKAHRKRPIREEGSGESGRWLLLDLGDVIVHFFDEEARQYYDIDGLWADVPRVAIG
jgi:ribosome-associated protein